jgi:hypothetical protein
MVRLELNDVDANGLIRAGNNDTVGGLIVNAVWQNDTITVTMAGMTRTITGVTFYRNGGTAVFTPTDGTVLGTATFVRSTYVTTSTQTTVGSLGPACFLRGTWLDTPQGPRRPPPATDPRAPKGGMRRRAMGAAMPLPPGAASALNRPVVRIIGKKMPRIAPVRALPSGIGRVCRPPAAPGQDPDLGSNPDQACWQAAKGRLPPVAPAKRIRLQRLQPLAVSFETYPTGGAGGVKSPARGAGYHGQRFSACGIPST